MRLFKRVISLISAIAMSSSLCAISHAEDAVVLFSENFDSYKTNSTPTSVDVYCNTNTALKIAEVPSAEDKSLCLTGTKNNTYFQKTFSAIEGKFYIQADIRFEQINNAVLMLELRNASGRAFVCDQMIAGNHKLFNNEVCAKYNAGSFKNVVWGFDTDKQVMNMWVNGRKVLRNASIIGREFTELAFVRFQLTQIPFESTVYVNNIVFAQGDYIPSKASNQNTTIDDDDDDQSNPNTADNGVLTPMQKVSKGVCYYEKRHNALINGKKLRLMPHPLALTVKSTCR